MEVEWLILADSAQVIGNKLYLLGGGWDRLTVNRGFPANQRCAVALSVKVPWNDTNVKHNFEIEVLAEDAASEETKSILKLGGQFEAGRPPGIPLGQDQRIQLAVEMNLKFESPCTMEIVARLDGSDEGRTHFRVVAGPMVAMIGQQGQAT